jgi:hypothetical protein
VQIALGYRREHELVRGWKELLCAFGPFTFRFPGLLLAPDRLPSDTLSSVDGYPPERASPASEPPLTSIPSLL